MATNYKVEDIKTKLLLMPSEDERAKLIWGHIKQNYITLTEFKELVKHI